MNNFIKNVLANIVAILIVFGVFIMFFVFMLIIGSMSGSSTPKVKDNSILTLTHNINIIDGPTEDNEGFPLFSGDMPKNVLIYDMLEAIKKAKTDDKIKGISIESDIVRAGITQLDDIRAALEDFKKSGKFVYAYGNVVSQSSYYLGSVADQYYLNPVGGIELKGMATEVVFLKNFADKYGIGIDVIRHGKFKAAVEPFMRNDISEENKEQLSTLLNDIWGNTTKKIQASRKIDAAQLKLVTDSLYGIIPENNTKYKLVDKLLQKSEYENIIRKKLNLKEKDKLNRVSFNKYIDSFKKGKTSKDEVAVLYASGAIYNGKGYDAIYAENYVKEIKKLQEDDKVKAVVLRINSPGGSANASDEILFELQQLKTKKPLIVSFGDYAASGGYYIAMAGDRIYSEPNTLTGSIGVFGAIPNFEEVAKRNGIRSDIVQTNENTAYYSTFHGVTPHGLAMLTKSVEETYKRFTGHVMKNRKMTFEQVDAIGGGRVWSGVRAKELNLVDELGTLNDAIAYASQKANVKDFSVKSYPKKMSTFEQFMKDFSGGEDLETKFIKNKLGQENFNIYKQLTNPELQNRVMMQFPFSISY